MRILSLILGGVCTLGLASGVQAAEVKIGAPAPHFKLKTYLGENFDLNSRKGKWTVLYFYPKADTPGCTVQACAYRDTMSKIRETGAEVFGISTDDPDSIAKFHAGQKLNFVLLSDPDAKVTEAYGVKMPLVKMAKRWTFVVDPELIVRRVDSGVDPVSDAPKMAEFLRSVQSSSAPVSASKALAPAKK